MPDDEFPETGDDLTESSEPAELTEEEQAAARLAAVVFDDETEAAVLAVAVTYLLPAASLLEAVRRLVADAVLFSPPSAPLAPDAEARVQLRRFADAIPEDEV